MALVQNIPVSDLLVVPGDLPTDARERAAELATLATLSGRPEDRLRTLRAGFQIHVTKPVPPLELATVMARLGARLQRPPSDDGSGDRDGG